METDNKYISYAIGDTDLYEVLDILESIRKKAFFSNNDELAEKVEQASYILREFSNKIEETESGKYKDVPLGYFTHFAS